MRRMVEFRIWNDLALSKLTSSSATMISQPMISFARSSKSRIARSSKIRPQKFIVACNFRSTVFSSIRAAQQFIWFPRRLFSRPLRLGQSALADCFWAEMRRPGPSLTFLTIARVLKSFVLNHKISFPSSSYGKGIATDFKLASEVKLSRGRSRRGAFEDQLFNFKPQPY